jgi:methionine synthase II (cobalamin-independent)
MFATLLGDLPRPPLPEGADAAGFLEAAVEAQVSAGLEPIGDGGWATVVSPVEAWLETSRCTDRLVKQALVGPFSASQGSAGSDASAAPRSGRATGAALEAARATNTVLRDLAAAGCSFIEIHETALPGIGADAAEWAVVRELHDVMTDGVEGTHLSLAITGGSIDQAGFHHLLAVPFASFALDLVAGPANWRFVRVVPGDRGIVCGAMAPTIDGDEGPETQLWAAAYAASSHGRGRDRVGLATASSLRDLPWDVAVHKLERLGAAVRLAQGSVDELRAGLDPRSIDARTAALGHGPPARRRDP